MGSNEANQIIHIAELAVARNVLAQGAHQNHDHKAHQKHDHHERVEDGEPVNLERINQIMKLISERSTNAVLKESCVKVLFKAFGEFDLRRLELHLQEC